MYFKKGIYLLSFFLFCKCLLVPVVYSAQDISAISCYHSCSETPLCISEILRQNELVGFAQTVIFNCSDSEIDVVLRDGAYFLSSAEC